MKLEAYLQRSPPILHGLFCWLFLVFALFLPSVGCVDSPSAKINGEGSVNSGDTALASQSTVSKTPLRIYASLTKEVLDVVARRWAGFSEQPIELHTLDNQTILAASDSKTSPENAKKLKPQVDVLIVESRWLATLAESKWARPLPISLKDLIPDVSHWERVSTYGQRLWGLPLGTNFLVSIENKDEKSLSEPQATDNASTIDSQLTENGMDWIVERFLVTAAADNPTPSDSSFLFRPTGAKSRLNEDWLSQSAKRFAQQYNESTSSFAARIALYSQPPEAMWKQVRNGTALAGLGWPDSIDSTKDSELSKKDSSPLVSEQSIQITPPTAWTDSGRSLLILVADTNRQSAASENFIRWLSENPQRQALAELTSQIKPIPENQRKVTDRPDRDKYHDVIAAALDDRYVTIELQFSGAAAYRSALSNALLKIIRNELTPEKALLECHQEWESITDRRGRENQQRLLYKSLGLGKWES